MKVLGVEKRDVYAAIEFSLPELRNIETFLKTVVPMYNHVYGDSESNLTEEMSQFHADIETLIKEIDNGS